MNSNNPNLIEPGVKYFVSQTLKECNRVKNDNMNILYNILFTLLFVIVVGGLFYYKYKGKPSKEEIERKQREKYQYIMSKLHFIQHNKNRANNNLITNLPSWDNHPENKILNN